MKAHVECVIERGRGRASELVKPQELSRANGLKLRVESPLMVLIGYLFRLEAEQQSK